MLPNFIIAGAQKSGTTSLYDLLSGHSQCIMSNPKEPHFFSKKDNVGRSKGIKKYEECFSGDNPTFGNVIVGEASTSYMCNLDSPRLIYNTLGGDVKICFMIRNPVYRAISAYFHYYKNFVDNRSINEVFLPLLKEGMDESSVIRNEKERIKKSIAKKEIDFENLVGRWRFDDPAWGFHYIYNGMYSKHINNYYSFFSKKNILILIFEDFVKNQELTIGKICKFLDISEKVFVDKELKQSNKTLVPRRSMFCSGLRSIKTAIPKPLKEIFPEPLINLYRKIVIDQAPSPNDEVVSSLNVFFEGEKERIANIVSNDVKKFW